MTSWRRLRDWHAAGVWQQLHELLLADTGRMQGDDRLDWSRAVIDSSQVRALKDGPKPVRARSTAPGRGSKHHLLTEAGGVPLAVGLTGAHRNDVTQLLPLLDKVPRVRGRRGRPRHRPERLYADRGYDPDRYRRRVRCRCRKSHP
jgi:transposase